LSGRKLKGEWQLIRSNREGDRQMWFFGKVRPSMRLVSKQRDDESALTRRTIEQIRTADDAVWNSKRSPAA
jgi:hypothetical protein